MQPLKPIIHQTAYIDIYQCARCGEDHMQLKFSRFHRPVVDSDSTTWEWFAECPVVYEPILMRATKTDSGYVPEEER